MVINKGQISNLIGEEAGLNGRLELLISTVHMHHNLLDPSRPLYSSDESI